MIKRITFLFFGMLIGTTGVFGQCSAPVVPSPQVTGYACRNFNISNANLNSTGNNVLTDVLPGASITISFNWNVSQSCSFCDGCIIQVYYGIKGSFSNCIASFTGYVNGGGTASTTFTAPVDSGIYYITMGGSLDFSCNGDLNNPSCSSSSAIAAIVVGPLPDNTASVTVSGEQTLCPSDSTDITATASGSGCFGALTDFQWTHDGTEISGANSAVYTAKQPGKYVVRWFNCNESVSDSITIADISSTSSITTDGCDSITVNGETFYADGTYMQVLTNSAGCDSTITLNLTVNYGSSSTITETACDSIELNGETFYADGTYTQTLTNNAGCDSTITLELTINRSSSSTITETACDSIEVNGETFYADGTYTQTLTNNTGCDSTITLELTINRSSSSTITETACDSIELNGETFYADGTYTQTLTNSAGCDSTITLELTINYTIINDITETACDAYSLNGQIYTETGMFTQTLSTAAGCDSIINLDLTIVTMDTSVTVTATTLTANAAGASYQWVDCNDGFNPVPGETNADFTPSMDGDYAVIVESGSCVDTSACYNFIVLSTGRFNAKEAIAFYPNPGSGIFHIRSLSSGKTPALLNIYNNMGQLIQTAQLTFRKEEVVDLSKENNGIYFAQLIQQSGIIQVQKIIKE